ncbi:MAG: hypothetical protein JHC98_10790 [Thermoleophilaceae bacterium]|nr:hypothetical protein [Thermoleophilaceae bacterium]
MEYAIIPLLFGFVTACVGKYKGMSFFLWFLIGTVLPFVGLIAAILFRTERYDPRRECPNCGAVVPITTQVCLRCGEDLEYPDELIAPKGFTVVDEDDAETA